MPVAAALHAPMASTIVASQTVTDNRGLSPLRVSRASAAGHNQVRDAP